MVHVGQQQIEGTRNVEVVYGGLSSTRFKENGSSRDCFRASSELETLF